MAYMNGADQLLLQTLLKGDSAFIRFSASADGTDFTETWTEGQKYIGFATGQEAPTNKSGYQWVHIAQSESVDLSAYVEKIDNSSSTMLVYCSLASNGGQGSRSAKTSITSNETAGTIPMRAPHSNANHPGTFEVEHPVLTEDAKGFSKKHPMTVGATLDLINELKADLSYVAIDITKFYPNTSVYEKGSSVSTIILYWIANKAPAKLTLDGVEKDFTEGATNGSITVNKTISSDKTWALVATDEKGATDTAQASISFVNGVYYGTSSQTSAGSAEAEINAFILGLSKNLQSTRQKTFTVEAGEGEYIYYCVPTNYGECSFKVGGFEGGFSLVATVSFTNAYNFTYPYYIYRSDNASLGNTTVNVT